MYNTNFLQDGGRLEKRVKQCIEETVEQTHYTMHQILHFDDCDLIFITNAKKVVSGEYFHESPCDPDQLYIFVSEAVNEVVEKDPQRVKDNLTDHLHSGLYATARAAQIGLDADCGLLEEVISEGLAGHFMREQSSSGKVKPHFTSLKKQEVEELWKRIQDECLNEKNSTIERWFQGSDTEHIPPRAGTIVGYAVVGDYLKKVGGDSKAALSTPAADIAAVLR